MPQGQTGCTAALKRAHAQQGLEWWVSERAPEATQCYSVPAWHLRGSGASLWVLSHKAQAPCEAVLGSCGRASCYLQHMHRIHSPRRHASALTSTPPFAGMLGDGLANWLLASIPSPPPCARAFAAPTEAPPLPAQTPDSPMLDAALSPCACMRAPAASAVATGAAGDDTGKRGASARSPARAGSSAHAVEACGGMGNGDLMLYEHAEAARLAGGFQCACSWCACWGSAAGAAGAASCVATGGERPRVSACEASGCRSVGGDTHSRPEPSVATGGLQ